MPLVHIELLEGRKPEQLKQLVQDVTAAITKNTGAPAEHVHIVLNEMQTDHYAVGGVLKSDQ
ncbi:4-oxalocrotonate tautomerase [Bombilactobacillus mellifer]|uniref:Tautomerase n=1 Tax=Bombilactobacillus mellifer TaxID=1218492 RepID=A0A0F4LT27_9LACO|nr:2-hydroxymuconate tautomerase [Bombilactobacillus mellifer]KJY61755.1 4-oxalocrotonate tautomerase [Bombilactobacillus mellifer]MCT6825753.1 4-oxalocrotonate tautomerase [Bombilactobacillus mellifer]MCT6843200.1 4-oxalocrotonate tautomerase [Bombilactobacillus mellifer]MCT6894499.1 4-oxalocrotonate tautomerase [Bombilactobacillus mellifer]